MSGLDFLNQNESAVKIPTGGDWTPSGMIGQWKAQVLFSFYSKTDFNMAQTELRPLISRKMGDGYRYYFKTSEQANQMKEALGEEFTPAQTWYWSTPRGSVLNVDQENLNKFSESISMELKIATLGSKKHRHELHLIALPSAVATAAKLMGYECPVMDFRDLISNQTIFDDAFALRVAGLGDDKEAFKSSTLWKQREVIWSALGEPDATKYQPIKTGTKFDTVSVKLSECLKILAQPWQSSVWGRVVQVPDPKVDAVYGDENKRLTIPALTEIFSDEKAARQVASEELKQRDERKSKASASSNGASGVPAAYANDAEVWWNYVGEFVGKPEVKGKPRPIVRAYLEKTVEFGQSGVTVDELTDAVMSKMSK